MKAFNTISHKSIFQEFQMAKANCFNFHFCSFILCHSTFFVFQSLLALCMSSFCLQARIKVTYLVGFFLCSFIFVFCIVLQVFFLLCLFLLHDPQHSCLWPLWGWPSVLQMFSLFALLVSFCNHVIDIKILGVFFCSNSFCHPFYKRLWVMLFIMLICFQI